MLGSSGELTMFWEHYSISPNPFTSNFSVRVSLQESLLFSIDPLRMLLLRSHCPKGLMSHFSVFLFWWVIKSGLFHPLFYSIRASSYNHNDFRLLARTRFSSFDQWQFSSKSFLDLVFTTNKGFRFHFRSLYWSKIILPLELFVHKYMCNC